jgi:hypothetical protein
MWPPRSPHQDAGPKLRVACEACHEKKIRCLSSIGGGPCRPCATSGRRCFYVPRATPGPRRRTATSCDDLLVSDSNSETNGYEEHSWQDIWPRSSALLDTPNSSHLPTSLLTESRDTAGEPSNSHCDVDISGLSNIPLWSTRNSEDGRGVTHEGENLFTANLDKSSALLKTCSNIHTIYSKARTAWNSPEIERASTDVEILSMLQCMDTIGHFILSQVLDISTQDPADLSLLSLILAGLIRLKETGALLGQIYAADLGSSSRRQIQERIQFNVTQTNTALKQVAKCHLALRTLVDDIL